MERTLSSELFFEEKAVNTQASLPLRVIANLMLWQRRISSRHQLARLDSRLLADARPLSSPALAPCRCAIPARRWHR